MSSSSRRSMLQTEIILQLRGQPAPSISAVARVVGSSRPSVSRSLHTLGEQGYVRREGRVWHLTEVGEAEAEAAAAKLMESAEDTVELAGRRFKAVSRLGQAHTLASIVNEAFRMPREDVGAAVLGNWRDSIRSLGSLAVHSVAEDPVASLTGGRMLRSVRDAAAGYAPTTMPFESSLRIAEAVVGKTSLAESTKASMAALAGEATLDSLKAMGSVSQIADLSVASFAAGATADGALAALSDSVSHYVDAVASPLVAAQDHFGSFLSLIPPSDQSLGYRAIAQQTNLLAGAMDHVLGLQKAESALLTGRAGAAVDLAWIPENLTAVTESLSDVFRDHVDQLRLSTSVETVPSLAERMVLSTVPVTHYASAARYFVEAEIEPDLPPLPRRGAVEYGNERLDPLLDRLDPDFVGKRRGAWMALASENPDRLCHAAGSHKNLLTQLLRLLVPDLEVPEDEQPGSKIKARVRGLLGGSSSEASHVKAVADAVYTGYSVLNKYDHTNQKHEAHLRAVLHTAEGLMEIILVNMSERPVHR